MRLYSLLVLLIIISGTVESQTSDEIIKELKEINRSVAGSPCMNNTRLVSNRAMNVFLADKSSYLSGRNDLSLYTNYVTINSMAGELAVNHVFHSAKGVDEPVRTFFSLGIKANIADGFASTFQDRKFNKELGVMLSYSLLGKVKMSATCDAINSSATSDHKKNMDALRASLVSMLSLMVQKKSEEFEKALELVEADKDFPGQDINTYKTIARSKFYADLKEEFAGRFAKEQAMLLEKTKNYKNINSNWTIISAYIPLISPEYDIAKSFNNNFEEKNSFPFEVVLSHTRMCENSKLGRFFFTLSGKLSGNNSRISYQLDKVIAEEYRNLGGTDTLRLAQLGSRPAYIGTYKNFISPSAQAKITYFPPDWHLGLSYTHEQNFGDFKLMNARIGIPVVLINSNRLPALNFEFQLHFFDLTNKILSNRKYDNKTAVSISAGIPMSRLIY